MNADSIYAFYGSLRRGMENYNVYEKDLSYLFSARIKGFKLYSTGPFPCAVKASDEDAIVVEVYKVTDHDTEKNIHDMELEEGYIFDEVVIDGRVTGIYLYETPGNYQEVKGGDWVSFFRQRTVSK